MIRILWRGFAALLLVAASQTAGSAVTISLNPPVQTVNAGDPVFVDLLVEGLGVGAAPSIGAYDIDVLFDPAILAIADVMFGDPVLGNQLDLMGFGSLSFFTDSLGGSVNVFELSLDAPADLDTLQAGAFQLAKLTFQAKSAGVSPLTLSVFALSDADGLPITDFGVNAAEVSAQTAVPEPNAGALVLLGLASLAALRRRR